MKKILLALLFISVGLFASTDLENAYAKEFAFLKAQKEMLKSRVEQVKKENVSKLTQAKNDLDTLQQKVLAKETLSTKLSDELYTAQQNLEAMSDDTSLTQAVALQGASLLKENKIDITIDDKNYVQTINEVFAKSLELAKTFSSIRIEDGEFYLKDGSSKKATLVKIGNIATYGISDSIASALVPAGDKKLKIWADTTASETARALATNTKVDTLNIFIYEDANKEIGDKEEKTVLDIINSAGIIGWVIVALGVLGLLFLVLRVFFLLSNSGSESLPTQTLQNLVKNGVENTLEFLKPKKGSNARVLKATVRNIERDREHIEDIISESIMHESTRLDKLSSIILVIAAVAPLLGLLGTVTGMIATFDIITEFGTGDPKLLSGGISIALVTTELGLIVAIPLLLGGNLLNSWSEGIKDNMEHSALHIVNEYNKQK
jgi:biopolymer transport protein ExbB